MGIFFTSDTHFSHFNIIDFCKRTIYEIGGVVPACYSRADACGKMNDLIVQRWNEKIGPTDEVYHLGDFAFCSPKIADQILCKLNGIKYLIRGNHDRKIIKREEVSKHFQWIRDYYVLMVHDVMQDKQDETVFHQYHQPR